MNAESAPPPRRPSWRGVLILLLAAIVAALVMSAVQRLTRERIAKQRQAAIVAQLREVIPSLHFDNAFVDERQALEAPGFFQTDQALWWYPVRLQGRLQAVIFDLVTAEGYNGDIRLLIGISASGRVTGVRVTQHLETPGLGDGIDYQKSLWVEQFLFHTLEPEQQWQLRRYGGDFDALSGATVTSSAMIAAVERGLRYFHQQGLSYWQQAPLSTPAAADQEAAQ